MKKKDIIVISMCIVIIAVSVYFIFRSLRPKAPEAPVQQKETMEFTGEIDKKKIEELKNRKPYGVPSMEGIGRENPFASL